MKLIEFINRKEGEILSNAWLTFGRFIGFGGLYVSFCIPIMKMEQRDPQDFMRNTPINTIIYGWYGKRIWFGFRYYKSRFNWVGNAFWELIKPISTRTDGESSG